MHIVTPICIFFVRRAVRSSLCVIPTRRPASARFKPSLYHSKVNVASSILLLSSLYAHFAAKPRTSSGALLCVFCVKKPRAEARGLKYQTLASASDFLGLTIAARPSASRPKTTAGRIQYRPMSYRGRRSIAGTLNAHRMLAPTAPRAAPRLT